MIFLVHLRLDFDPSREVRCSSVLWEGFQVFGAFWTWGLVMLKYSKPMLGGGEGKGQRGELQAGLMRGIGTQKSHGPVPGTLYLLSKSWPCGPRLSL